MPKLIRSSHLLFAMVCLLTGCKKYYEFIPMEIPQPTKGGIESYAIDRWKQKIAFYDQFSTLGIFDVLKLSDEVVQTSVKLASFRKGIIGKEYDKLMRESIRNNQKELTWYLLVDVRDENSPALGQAGSPWRFWVECSDHRVVKPTSIRSIGWTPELYYLFGGKKETSFKTLYKMVFPLCGSDMVDGKIRKGPMSFVITHPHGKRKAHWMAESGWTRAPKKQVKK